MIDDEEGGGGGRAQIRSCSYLVSPTLSSGRVLRSSCEQGRIGYGQRGGGYDVMHDVISGHDYRESAYFCICL